MINKFTIVPVGSLTTVSLHYSIFTLHETKIGNGNGTGINGF